MPARPAPTTAPATSTKRKHVSAGALTPPRSQPKKERATSSSNGYKSGRDAEQPLIRRLAERRDTKGASSAWLRCSSVHSFLVEPSFLVVSPHLWPWLAADEIDALERTCSTLQRYQLARRRLCDCDIDFLREPRADWSSQVELDEQRQDALLALALRLNFDVGAMVTWLGGEYACTYRDVGCILDDVRPRLPPDEYDDLRRVLTVGAPAWICGESTLENQEEYLAYGNHRSADEDPAATWKAINKDERASHLFCLPEWTAPLVPNLHVSPLGLLVKKGKTRLIFDASFRPSSSSVAINDVTHKSDEPPTDIGTALTRHIARIWNLRITFPSEDILLWDDDVKSAFRHVRYHLSVIAAFAFRFAGLLCLPLGMVFGSNVSPGEFDIVARARATLATSLSESIFDGEAEASSFDIEELISMPDEPGPDVTFAQASADSLNTGVLDAQGRMLPTPNVTFVDDNMLADVRQRIRVCIHTSIRALFMILGWPEPSRRALAVALDKFSDRALSHRRVQLGLLFDTRTLTVSLPDEKRELLLALLEQWGPRRRAFTARQAAELLGLLQHACTVCPWGKYLFLDLRWDLDRLLWQNRLRFRARRAKQFAAAISARARGEPLDENAAIWKDSTRARLSGRSISNIELLRRFFQGDDDLPRWEAPMAWLIPRDVEWSGRGDASLVAGGGYSDDLRFFFFLPWSDQVKKRNIVRYMKGMVVKADLITINDLEFAVIILMYAATIVAAAEMTDLPAGGHPVALFETDSMTALSRLERPPTRGSVVCSALLRVFAAVQIGAPVGVNAQHIAGKDNVIADDISRPLSHATDTSHLQDLYRLHPRLRGYRRYLPSAELVSAICTALVARSPAPVPFDLPLGRLLPADSSA